MRVFFDTEFTQFRDGELLSIGLLAEDGQTLVVEIDEPRLHGRASDFCKQNVLPQFGLLPSSVVSGPGQAGEIIGSWLTQLGSHLDMCYDYKLDWHFLSSSLGLAGASQMLDNVLRPINIADFANFEACLTAQEEYFIGKTRPGRHHPLIDAYALRERWKMYVQLTSAPMSDRADR